MVRGLSLYLPWWPIERLARRRAMLHDDPGADQKRCILLVATIADRQVVEVACPPATQAGVTPGMTLAHARALLPDMPQKPFIQEYAPERDRTGLTKLAQWMTRLVPVVASDPPDGLSMNITGCNRLYRGEENLLQAAIGEVKRLGFTAMAAIAPTFGAAWALARFGEGERRIIEHHNQIRAALAPLSVAALRIDDETIETLAEVGIRSIGEVLDVPRSQLPARFSDDLLLRIDQAFGQAIETIDPVRIVPRVQESETFAGPVKDIEVIQLAAHQLLERVSVQLLHREAGARTLCLTLDRFDADPVSVSITNSRPTRNVKHLWRLLQPKLEDIHLGYGVETITLAVRAEARLPHQQISHPHLGKDEETHEMDAEQGRLLDVLIHQFGHEQVFRMQHAESHLPERTVRQAVIDGSHNEDRMEMRFATPPHRPTRLLEKPEPIDVQIMTPDGPIVQISRAGCWQPVLQSIGPERLALEWWRGPSGEREYFRIAIKTGMWLWVFRDVRRSSWFLHGMWA